MKTRREKGKYSTARLVLGIISIVLFIIIGLQSFIVLVDHALSANADRSGMLGILVALLVLVAGIIGIATRNSKANVGSIISTVLYGLGGIVSFCGTNAYIGLRIWGVVVLGFGVVFLFSSIQKKKVLY